MIEEPKEKPLEDSEESPEEALPGRSKPGAAPPEPSLSRGDSIRRYSARAFRAVVDSFRWLVGGKARISATVGVFAAFIVAIGFTLFDMQREDWMLEQMYPQGHCALVKVEGLSGKLCGAHRPGHFAGVCTIVAKLFNIVGPDFAYFGQKDAQQAAVIKRRKQHKG